MSESFYLFVLATLGLPWCLWAFSSCTKWGLLFVGTQRLLTASLSSCNMQTQQSWLTGPRAQAQQSSCTGLVAPRHVGSSQTRDRTCVPHTGKGIFIPLYHKGSPEAQILVKVISQATEKVIFKLRFNMYCGALGMCCSS